jgi:hypothetical protein
MTLFAEGVLNPSNCQRSEAERKLSLQQAAGNPQVEAEAVPGLFHPLLPYARNTLILI